LLFHADEGAPNSLLACEEEEGEAIAKGKSRALELSRQARQMLLGPASLRRMLSRDRVDAYEMARSLQRQRIETTKSELLAGGGTWMTKYLMSAEDIKERSSIRCDEPGWRERLRKCVTDLEKIKAEQGGEGLPRRIHADFQERMHGFCGVRSWVGYNLPENSDIRMEVQQNWAG
ncbi:unnamed protein product, partial [Amoebophrya sp. A25]